MATKSGYVEHSIALKNGHVPSTEEMGAAYHLLNKLPSVAMRVVVFGQGNSSCRPRWLSRVCDFDHVRADRNHLVFEAPMLGTVAPKEFSGQQHLFSSEVVDPKLTAFSLMALGLADIKTDENSDRLDSYLLDSFISSTRKIFRRTGNLLELDQLQDHDDIMIDNSVRIKAQALRRKIKEPSPIRLRGKLSLLRSQGNAFEITTESGIEFKCALINQPIVSVKKKFETEVVIFGDVIYRPSGEVQRIDVLNVIDKKKEHVNSSLFSTEPWIRRNSFRTQLLAKQIDGALSDFEEVFLNSLQEEINLVRKNTIRKNYRFVSDVIP